MTNKMLQFIFGRGSQKQSNLKKYLELSRLNDLEILRNREVMIDIRNTATSKEEIYQRLKEAGILDEEQV